LISILHIMFVDDVLIITKESFTEWQEIHSLLYSFCGASRLNINVNKSTFHHFGTSQILLDNLNALFQFGIMNLETGFKYIGYFLKISWYKEVDWLWLTQKYETRINHCCNRFLSMGGRFALIKDVLESQPVYWLALAHIPISILNQIRMLDFPYLWTGENKNLSIHLCKWETLALPKKFGGWGLSNIFCFSQALAAK